MTVPAKLQKPVCSVADAVLTKFYKQMTDPDHVDST